MFDFKNLNDPWKLVSEACETLGEVPPTPPPPPTRVESIAPVGQIAPDPSARTALRTAPADSEIAGLLRAAREHGHAIEQTLGGAAEG